MTLVGVVERFGTAALIRFVAALVLFLVLHLIRLPLVIAARVIEACLHRVDAYATRQASTPPTRPRTHWFPKEADTHAYSA